MSGELKRVSPHHVTYNEDTNAFDVLEEYEELYNLEEGFIFYQDEKIYYQEHPNGWVGSNVEELEEQEY